MEVFVKRRELWIFILSVVFLSGVMGMVANILFTEFYSENKVVFITTVLITMTVTIFIILKLMLKNSTNNFITNMILTYDFNKKQFIDVPYNYASVNARVTQDNLSKLDREKTKFISLEDKNKEFTKLSNNIVAQIIFSRFIRHLPSKYSETVSTEKLMKVIVVYEYLVRDYIIGENNKLSLPKGFKIDSTSDKNILMKSQYGFINFYWKTIITTDTSTSKYLAGFDELDLNNCIELHVQIKFEYGYNIFKLFKDDTVEFNEFVEACKEKMKEFDLNYSKERLNKEIYINMSDYILKEIKKLHD